MRAPRHDACTLGACSGTLRAECRHPGFVCYAAGERGMAPATLSLDHRWGARDARLVRTLGLCNPSSTAGAFVAQPAPPLVCYDERRGEPTDREVSIENRFGEATVTLGRPAGVCLPSLLQGTTAPPSDAFACYRVRDRQRLRQTMTLQDRFGSQEVRIRRLRTVCVPTGVNGTRVIDARTGLACYEVRAAKRRPPFLPQDSTLANALGERTLAATRTQLACVPTTFASCGRLVSTATSGTTSCGGPALEPPPVAPFSGGLFDAAGTELAGLGLGCLHYGGGDSEYYPSPLAPDGATSIYDLASCEGDHRVLLGSAGSGPASCTLAPGPHRVCTANPRITCDDNADCTASGGTCNPVPRCFAGLPLPVFGAIPSCVLNVVAEDGGGWVDVSTGAANFGSPTLIYVYLTLDQGSPCPRCVEGICQGGQRSGRACTPANPDGLTHDCPPSDSRFFNALDLRSDLSVGGGGGTGRSESGTRWSLLCRTGRPRGVRTSRRATHRAGGVPGRESSRRASAPLRPGQYGMHPEQRRSSRRRPRGPSRSIGAEQAGTAQTGRVSEAVEPETICNGGTSSACATRSQRAVAWRRTPRSGYAATAHRQSLLISSSVFPLVSGTFAITKSSVRTPSVA